MTSSGESPSLLLQADLTEALDRVRGLMATNVRDWGMDRGDAWLYGLFCGWDCEERFDDPEHDCADPDDTCEGQAAMAEVARRWHWTRDDVARLRRYREVIRKTQRPDAEGKERSGP